MMLLIIILMVATLLVLLAGIIVMMKGGELNKRYGNKLMVARVSLQAAAIGLLGLVFMFGGKH